MTASTDAADDRGRALLDLYDVALPHVHGYLLRRCVDASRCCSPRRPIPPGRPPARPTLEGGPP